MDGSSYLYYDISSTQNVAQLYGDRTISRSWMKDFLWSMKQVHLELGRFLMDDRNLLWYPEQIFQDLDKNDFFFLYIPYYEGECGFSKLIEYWVEHIDYEDDALVEYIYKMYEQYDLLGTIYLEEQIYEDAKMLETEKLSKNIPEIVRSRAEEAAARDFVSGKKESAAVLEEAHKQLKAFQEEKGGDTSETGKATKKGFRNLLENRRNRQKAERESFRQEVQQMMSSEYAVCEEHAYQNKNYGRTIYLEETQEQEEIENKAKMAPRLYHKDGTVTEITKTPFLIGKKQEEVDLCLTEKFISRIHAKIVSENDGIYLEDLNSTNGTFKNGLRMRPYEKKKLEPGDEVRFGGHSSLFGRER
jgi:hypothetical protein